jgi:hypothetical protein
MLEAQIDAPLHTKICRSHGHLTIKPSLSRIKILAQGHLTVKMISFASKLTTGSLNRHLTKQTLHNPFCDPWRK